MSEHCTFYILRRNAPIDERIFGAIEKIATLHKVNLGIELWVWTEWIDEYTEDIFGPEQHGEPDENTPPDHLIFWPDGRNGFYEWLEEARDKGYAFWIDDQGW